MAIACPLTLCDRTSQDLRGDQRKVIVGQLVEAGDMKVDPILELETGRLAKLLDLPDHVTDQATAQQIFVQSQIEGYDLAALA